MPRPTTITCEICGKPAPNSARGQYRKYHLDCQAKLRASRRKERRDADEELRLKEKEAAARRRELRKSDPKALEHEREMNRLRQARRRAKVEVYSETQRELAQSRIELQKASATLTEAAYNVNSKIVDHEQRLQALERRNRERDD